jgi:two-component system response regulator DevR
MVAADLIRVFLVDDHEMVRDGVRALLEGEPDIVVVGEAGTAAEALERIPAVRPDLTLLDLNLPDGSGIDVCRDLRSVDASVRVLVFTSVDDDEALLAAVLAGADGYVLKHIRGPDLLTDIRHVAHGGSVLDQQTRSLVLEQVRRNHGQHDGRVGGLTGQEQRVFELLADGLTNRVIADRLGLAEKTVKNYVSNVLAKLGMVRRTEAVVQSARLVERGKGRSRSDCGPAIRY